MNIDELKQKRTKVNKIIRTLNNLHDKDINDVSDFDIISRIETILVREDLRKNINYLSATKTRIDNAIKNAKKSNN